MKNKKSSVRPKERANILDTVLYFNLVGAVDEWYKALQFSENKSPQMVYLTWANSACFHPQAAQIVICFSSITGNGSCGFQVKDSLLLAIDEEYVEGVELLLQHEERTHQPGQKTTVNWGIACAVVVVYRAGSRLRDFGFDSCYLRTFFEVF